MARVYYNQADNRWANYPYPSPSLPKATIKSGGCGPTSCAMIVSSLKETIKPHDMAKLFLNIGLRVNGGTSSKAFSFISEHFGIDMFEIPSFSIQTPDKMTKVVEHLYNGGMCVAHCKGGGIFSTGGHYIVLAYMKNSNKIVVFDPYLYRNKFSSKSRAGKAIVDENDVIISTDNFMKYANCTTVYCFRPIQEQPKTILAHVKTKINKAPLRNSKEHNTNKNVITHLKKGTELDILEIDNEWGTAIQGYINMNDCERQELFKAEVIVDKAPLRNSMEHNTDKNVIQHLKKGTKLSIVERHNNEWWSAPQGYINENDCKKI